MYKNITNVNENWVYQSNKLIEASFSMTVLEQKLVRLLASFIKKDDVKFKSYEFKATELSELLKIHNKNIYKELDKATDKLMTRFIKIKDDKTQKFKKRHLIKIADFENGTLILKIDDEVKEFYLNLSWYTKYQLKNIMEFKSTYSFRFYEFFKQYEKIGERNIEINELKIMLEIPIDKYPKFPNLKQKVIEIAINEINSKTDLLIEYEPIRTGRKVTEIKFYIKAKNKINIPKENIIDEVAETKESNIESIDHQIEKVKEFTKKDFTDKAIAKFLDLSFSDIDKIKKCYEYMKTKEITKSKVGYMNTLIKNWEEPETSSKGTGFNNFEPRNLDDRYIELRNKILSGQATEEEEEEFYIMKNNR